MNYNFFFVFLGMSLRILNEAKQTVVNFETIHINEFFHYQTLKKMSCSARSIDDNLITERVYILLYRALEVAFFKKKTNSLKFEEIQVSDVDKLNLQVT